VKNPETNVSEIIVDEPNATVSWLAF